MKNAKNKIPAVFKEDLVKLLASLGEKDAIIAGERVCMICNKVINTDNIQLIIPMSQGKFEYLCTDIECVEHYKLPK